jgi:hypothetical protein
MHQRIVFFQINQQIVLTAFTFNRMLVYEFVNNGNLEQWLHGAMHQRDVFSWEVRMKVVTGTAKACVSYLSP